MTQPPPDRPSDEQTSSGIDPRTAPPSGAPSFESSTQPVAPSGPASVSSASPEPWSGTTPGQPGPAQGWTAQPPSAPAPQPGWAQGPPSQAEQPGWAPQASPSQQGWAPQGAPSQQGWAPQGPPPQQQGWAPQGAQPQQGWSGYAGGSNPGGPGYPPQAYPGAYPAQPLSPSDAKLWSVLAHVSVPFVGFLGPLIIWLAFRDRSTLVRDNGVEALNWSILATGSVLVASILTSVLIGFVLLPLIYAAVIVFAILGALAANRGEAYRYPVSWRLVK